eukprot:9191443-Alexandrium_andersonii.AAC.1
MPHVPSLLGTRHPSTKCLWQALLQEACGCLLLKPVCCGRRLDRSIGPTGWGALTRPRGRASGRRPSRRTRGSAGPSSRGRARAT